MSGPRFAVGPRLWRHEDVADGGETGFATMLDDAAAAGFAGIELGGGYPRDAASPALLAARGLALAAADYRLDLTDGQFIAMALNEVNGFLDALVAAGCPTLVMSVPLVPERARVAGRVNEAGARQLRDDEWQNLADALNELGERCKARGLALAYRPRVGTWVETTTELKKLMSLTDSGLVGLALDTGHCAYAGLDPLQALDTYRWRIRHVILQDLDPAVRDVALRHGLDYREALRRRIFPALGAGGVDLAGVAAKLTEQEYEGWIVAEQETSALPPREAASANRAALGRLFAAATPAG